MATRTGHDAIPARHLCPPGGDRAMMRKPGPHLRGIGAGLPRIALPDRIDAHAVMTRDPLASVMALGGESMGMGWRVWLVLPEGESAPSLHEAIAARLARIEGAMSHWRPDSDLMRFNAAAPGEWVSLPHDFVAVIGAALELAIASEGAFSPALGALVDLWGFGPPGPIARLPSERAIRAALAQCDYRQLSFDPLLGGLRQPGGLALDLSAIAKGFAVDALAEVLADRGVIHALVDVDGELRGAGVRPDGQPWWVDLETPFDVGIVPLRFALHGQSLATSGTTSRGSNTLDPRTGRPVSGGVTVCSVLHERAMLADGWASALLVLGPEAGLEIATKADLRARWIVSEPGGAEGPTFREVLSPALARLIED